MNAILNGIKTSILPLRAQMLTGPNRIAVIAAKAIFQKSIIEYSKKVIKPTRENCRKPLAIKLLGARDIFFSHNAEAPRRELMEAAWDILIEEIEHNDEYDIYWQDLINLLKEL